MSLLSARVREAARSAGVMAESGLWERLAAAVDTLPLESALRLRERALFSGQDHLRAAVRARQEPGQRAERPGLALDLVAALGDAFHPATAQAHADCVALGWSSDVFSGLMERFPRIALNGLRFLAGRLEEFQDRYRELATERVERRVARALLRLARQIGREVNGGPALNDALLSDSLDIASGGISSFAVLWNKSGKQVKAICALML